VLRWTVALGLAVATAHADPAERCTQGLAFAKKGDLPRAALYLEDCAKATLAPEVADEASRATAEVARKLEASKLSMMSISTSPDGMIGETDALPGERFATPATIWAKAGTYKVSVAADAESLGTDRAVTVAKSLEAHSRTSVIINAPAAAKPPKAGKADFNEEAAEQSAHEGPPPAVKHGTMMPKKYLHGEPATGSQIDDPLPDGVSNAQVAWRFGARIAGAIADRGDTSARLGFGVAATAGRPLGGPASLVARVDWTHHALDAFGFNFGLGVVVLERPAFTLSVDGQLRGEIRVQDMLGMTPVKRFGGGGAVDVDIAWLKLPIATALRYEQGFTEVASRALLLEVGYDWR
jgi:hypothetical protein